jgi:hypothetical protein
MSDSELKQALKKFEDDYDALKATANKIGLVESKESEKIDDRKFQVEMLRLQLSNESFSSVITAVMAIAISWIIAMLAISYSDIPDAQKFLPIFESVWMYIILVIAFVASVVVLFIYIPHKVNQLENKYAKSHETKPQQPKKDAQNKQP